ncbi:MAG: hypothetical protein MJZ72_10150, partial [Bacteroidales bacterium]|nr:hypothetical protein [Bacteroidales bacterium]
LSPLAARPRYFPWFDLKSLILITVMFFILSQIYEIPKWYPNFQNTIIKLIWVFGFLDPVSSFAAHPPPYLGLVVVDETVGMEIKKTPAGCKCFL